MPDLKVPVTSADRVRGNRTTSVMLVEYGDYQCPYCAQSEYAIRQLLRRFDGKLCHVFRHFPLTQLHPEAESAAETAEFAGSHAESAFWQAHEALYENQRMLGLPLYAEIIASLGLSRTELSKALAERSGFERIKADFDGGVASGVRGTPTFYINGRLHRGAGDADSLAAAIESA